MGTSIQGRNRLGCERHQEKKCDEGEGKKGKSEQESRKGTGKMEVCGDHQEESGKKVKRIEKELCGWDGEGGGE
jgi:hypothetical protein